jgi:putative transposase
MNIINEPLEPNSFYHIYNRGINSCKIFNSEENYKFFLIKFTQYLSNYVDVYSYCLMPNHFHFLVKVKSEAELESFVKVSNFDKAPKEGLHSINSVISKQFAKFLSSYTQAFNKASGRHGALLESPFKRKRIQADEYLINLIIYIHLNPIDINQDYQFYKFSSYLAIVSSLKTKIVREEVIEAFGDLENFIYVHKHPPKLDFKF